MTVREDLNAINSVYYPNFGIYVDTYIEGIKINQYRLKLPVDANVNKLIKMQNNLVIALKEKNIRVYQDVDELVIEKKVSDNILKFNDVFYYRMSNKIFLGKDLSGSTISTDITKAPHMLVSGCTGSGKTQFLHFVIASLLLDTPTAHLILIDPKGNEFNIYKDIETVEFIDDTQRAIEVLQWVTVEMDARYKRMQKMGISDISESETMNRIYVIIDEFADIIKTDRTIEKYIVRIAQKARACGIHLIIGTQYPKAEVLTGLIQANIPTRVCLRVLSNTQSRVAIERGGGEKLIGYGDMLFLGNGMYEPIRVQAPYISNEDKEFIVSKATESFKGKGGYIYKRTHPQLQKKSFFDKLFKR